MSNPQPISCAEPAESLRCEATADIRRGLGRLLHAHGASFVPELALANGRRADVAALDAKGEIWIVEVKSGVADFRADQKWPDYRDYCDRLFFAVAPSFPVEILPADTGLILCDRYGGEIARPAPEHRLAPARRKALTLSIARAACLRLLALSDPELAIDLARVE
jgi:hypothetical protein